MLDGITIAVQSNSDYVLLGVVFALVNVITELIKRVAGRNGKKPDRCLRPQQSSQLDCVHAVVSKTDDNGTPMVYSQRNLGDDVKELTRTIIPLVTSINQLRVAMDARVKLT